MYSKLSLKHLYAFSLFTTVLLILNSTFNSADAAPLSQIWKVQSNKPEEGLFFAFEQQLAIDVSVQTQGALILDVRSDNGHVGVREAFNALRLGKIDGMFMSPQY